MRYLARFSVCVFSLYIFTAAIPGITQEKEAMYVEGEILIGDKWNPETRKLEEVFKDQKVLDLGPDGVLSVQLWADIRNGAGKEVSWVVEYANGMRRDIYTQKIRYDRFRTFLKKTFRRKLWDGTKKKLVDVTGPCRIMLIDRENPKVPVAVKSITLK